MLRTMIRVFRRDLRPGPSAFWEHVRDLEMSVYGRYYHDLDGATLTGQEQTGVAWIEHTSLTVEDIRQMPMAEFAALRRRMTAP